MLGVLSRLVEYIELLRCRQISLHVLFDLLLQFVYFKEAPNERNFVLNKMLVPDHCLAEYFARLLVVKVATDAEDCTHDRLPGAEEV